MKQLTLRAAVVSLALGAAACDGKTPLVPGSAASEVAGSSAGAIELAYMADPGGNTFRIRNDGSTPVTLKYRTVGSTGGTALVVPARTEVFVAVASADPLEVLQGGIPILSAANGGAPAVPAPLCNGVAATIWPGAAGSSRTVGGSFASPTWQRWRLTGTGGGDVVLGSPFNDIIQGNAGDDVICGEGGNDQLYPGTGVNALYGGPGNDVLGTQNAVGTNTFDGGDGRDRLQLTSPGARIVVDLVAGTITGGYFDGGTVANVEDLRVLSSVPVEFYGDSLDNRLDGGSRADVLEGRGGNDVIRGNGGDDALRGGDGNDHLYARGGAATLEGGYGSDWLDGLNAAGVHRFDGGEGTDFLTTRSSGPLTIVRLQEGTISGGYYDGSTISGIENVSNGSVLAPVEFYGDRRRNVLRGGNQADVLEGGNGNDQLYGGSGADRLIGGFGWDTLVGGAGDDVLDGGQHGDNLHGGTGADAFMGGKGRDQAYDYTAADGDTNDGTVERGIG